MYVGVFPSDQMQVIVLKVSRICHQLAYILTEAYKRSFPFTLKSETSR